MHRFQANLYPGLKNVELLSHGDDGGQEGIALMFGGLNSIDTIRAAEIPWFDGQTIDLDGLRAAVAGLGEFGWATGQRDVYPAYDNGGMTFYVTP